MKKYLITLASAFLFSLTTLVAAETTTTAWTGAGTITNPYIITTEEGLFELATRVNAGETFEGYCFELGNDISLTKPWPGIGIYSETDMSKAFMGIFNGRVFKIQGVTFANNEGVNTYRGFFNQIYKAGIYSVDVYCYGFEESAQEGKHGGAIIVGHARSSRIQGCTAQGSLSGNHNVAGIVVRVSNEANGTMAVDRCENRASLTSSYTKVAGIVALSQSIETPFTIERCTNYGDISSTDTSLDIADNNNNNGGVAGIIAWVGYKGLGDAYDMPMKLQNCVNKGTITATSDKTPIGQIAAKVATKYEITGTNKGLTATIAADIAPVDGLNFATVNDTVATYTATLTAGNTYLVTAKGTKPEITLKAGESITFDESLTTIGDATGITSTEGVVTTRTNGNQITYFVEAPCATVNGTKMTLAAAFAHAKANNGTTITLDKDAKIDLGTWEPVVMDTVSFTLEGNGATITGLKQALIDSVTTGGAKVVIRDLTIDGAVNAGLASSHSGVVNAGALINVLGYCEITISNVHVKNATIGGDATYYAGGLVGYVAATADSILNIEGCSVTDSTMTSTSSSGGLFGHSNGGKTTIVNTTVGSNTIAGANAVKEGSLIGTLTGAGGTRIEVTETAKSTGTDTLNVVGRVYTGVVYTGGSYLTNPERASDTNDNTAITADGKIVEKDGKYIVAKAQIGASYYATLQNAVDAVTESANEIKLLGNVTELGTEVEANSGEFFVQVLDKDMTIDFAGFTLTGSVYVDSASTVKFKNGTITSLADNKSSGIESVGGNIELTNMTVFSSTRHAVRVKGGTAVINSGTYTSHGTGTMHALNITNTSTVTINDGIFIGNKGYSIAGGNAVMIDPRGGTLTVTINGGTFKDASGVEGCISAAEGLEIAGGVFDTWTYDNYLSTAKYYIAVKNADEMYEVVEATNWIQVADTSWFKNSDMVDGSAEKPYTIATAEGLGGLAKLVNEGTAFENLHITLGGDLDMSGLAWPGVGVYAEKAVGTAFQGTFDGNGKKITNVTFANTSSNKYRGFFNQLYRATVKNLTVETKGFESATSGSYGGAVIAGHAIGSTIEGCVAEGALTGTHNVAGIVVLIQGATIKNCTNKAKLSNNYTKLAGIVNFSQHKGVDAEHKGSLIENCINEGEITSTGNGANGVGGIIGWIGYGDGAASSDAAYAVTIKNCENKGVVAATASEKVGQIVGSGESYIVDGGSNKGLMTTLGIGSDNQGQYFAYAIVESGVATYTATLEAGNDYLVTAKGAKPVIELVAGESITFDQSLATIDVTGITAATKLIVDGYTYSAAAIAIGDTGYATLADAIDAANANDTITLLADIHLTETLVIAADKNITLDLAGFAITVDKVSETNHLYAFENYGTLTLTDSVGGGSITARGVQNHGTMVMDGGTIYTCDTNGGYGVWNYADFTMNGGAIKTTHHVGNESWTSSPTCLRNEIAAATATLKGGTLESTNVAVYVVISDGTLNVPEDSTVTVTGPRGVAINAGTATINGGTFTTIPTTEWKGWYALYVEEEVNATVTINGGIFDADGTFSVCLGNSDSNTATSSVTINGGTFKKPVAARGVNHTEALKITGGKFLNWDPACANADSLGWGEFDGTTYHIHGYVAEGKIGVQDADGYYTLTDGAYVAKTETQCYATVEEAIAAAAKAEKAEDKVVIVLTATASWSKDFALTEGVTVKLANAEMIANATAPNGYEWNADGVLIVKIVNWIQVADTAWFENAEPGTTSFTLDTARELAGLAKLVNAGNNFAGVTITLDADIDLAGLDWTPIGSATANPFAGTFDGDGKTISNLIITGNINFAGLFGRVGYNEGSGPAGTVKNVTIHNATIEGNYYAAAVVGVAQIATIDNCDVTGTINISTINHSVGGVVGRGNATIRNCDVVGTIKILPGSAYVGGIAGYGYFTIDNCHVDGADATVSSISVPSSYVGGIQGFTGEDGANKRMISNCSVKNLAITGVDTTGGIVGMSHYGVVLMNCAVDGVTLATTGNDGTIGAVAGTVNGKAEKPSKLYNCTVENTTVNGATATTLTSALTSSGVSNDNYFVGSDVVLDKANKVTAGLFTVFNEEAAVNVLAENAVWTKSGDVYIVEMAVAEMNGEKFTSLQAAINAAIEKIENNESATIKLLADVTEDVEIAHVELIIQAKLKALMLMEAADASAEESLPTATLDLNGYRIDGTVTVPEKTALDITDKSEAQSGSIKELVIETGANAEVDANAKIDFDAVDVETEASFAHAGSGTITNLTAAVGSTVSKNTAVDVTNQPAGTNWGEASEDGNHELTRNEFAVTITSVGGGSVTDAVTGSYVAGTELTLTAVANADNVFAGWTIQTATATQTATEARIMVEITAVTTVTAHFIPEALYEQVAAKVIVAHTTEVAMNPDIAVSADGKTVTVGLEIQKATTLESGKTDWTALPVTDVTVAEGAILADIAIPDGEKAAFFKFVSKNEQPATEE